MNKDFFKKNLTYFLFLIFAPVCLLSQQQLIPYVKNYSKSDYKGEALVWSITQTKDKRMYFANNKLLLQFDGNRWQQFSLPEKTIIRSIYAERNKIYSGSYKEFGYWQHIEDSLTYTSLSEKFKLFEETDNDEVWNILSFDSNIIFQTFFSIYVYDGETIKKYKTPSQITYAFEINNELMAASVTDGIYVFKDEKFVKDTRFDLLKNNVIHCIQPYKDGILFFTQKEGVFLYQNKNLRPWGNSLNTVFKDEMINSAKKISETVFAVGTSGNGLYMVDFESGLFTNFHRNNGALQNNSVLSIFQDAELNLWFGLDNGISFIQNDSNAFIYQDYTGKLGSVYAIQKTGKGFLLGSNHGLFKLENGNLELVPGTQGPIWSITQVGNQYILGHNNATLLYENGNIHEINRLPGGYRFKESNQGQFIQSNYIGLYNYKFQNGNWTNAKIAPKLLKPVNNFIVNDHHIWAVDTYKGVYRIDLETNEFEEVNSENNKEIYNAKIVEINKGIYFLSNRKWYEYDSWTAKLKLSKRLNDMLPDADNIEDLQNSNFLIESNGVLSVVNIINEEVKWHIIPDKYHKGKIVNDWTSAYLKDGYLYLNLDNGFLQYKVSFERTKPPIIYIDALVNGVQMSDGHGIGYYNNALDFYISTREYGYSEQNLYYKLLPLDDVYKPLKEGKLSYSHLSNGNYTLSIAIKSGNYFQELKTYEFRVKKPWFISNMMIVFYILFVSMIYFVYHNFIQRQNKQKLQQLEHEVELQKQLVRVKNEAEKKEVEHSAEKQKLEQDVKNKTTELASRALSVASQNELLIELESIMNNIDDEAPAKIKKDISKILKEYNYNQNEWKVFDANLHELHEDFVERLAKAYPDLTSKDIRLAIFLRMNMTSKEIAPLMRKSFRSVELQRYRLRKKMKLSSKTNLSKFFVNF